MKLKSIILTLALIALSTQLGANLDSGWERAQLGNGLSLWHHELPTAKTSAIKLYLPGTATLNSNSAALDRLGLAIMETAGQAWPRAKLEELKDRGGIQINSSSGPDYSWLGVRAVASETDQAANLLASLFTKPLIEPELLAELSTRLMAELDWQSGNPWNALERELKQKIYRGTRLEHYYGLDKEDFATVTEDSLKAHLKRVTSSDQNFIVSAGPQNLAEMLKIIDQAFEGLPPRASLVSRAWTILPEARDSFEVFSHLRAGSSWAKGVFLAPRPGSRHYPAYLLTARLWSELLMEKIRTQKGLVYSVWVSSPSRQRFPTGEFAFYRCSDLPQALSLARESLHELRSQNFDPQEFEDLIRATKAQVSTALALQDITPDEKTRTFAEWLLASGRPEAFSTLPRLINEVSLEDIVTSANLFFRKIHWGIMASPGTDDKNLSW